VLQASSQEPAYERQRKIIVSLSSVLRNRGMLQNLFLHHLFELKKMLAGESLRRERVLRLILGWCSFSLMCCLFCSVEA